MSASVPVTPLEPWIATKIGCPSAPVSLELLESYQLARLNETLSLVQERSPFYRRVLGTRPIVLSSLADIASLPLTTARQLGSRPLEFLCVPHDDVERIVTLPTSGTTGPHKRVFFSAVDQELTRDFFHRGMSTLVEAGDRVLILLPGESPGSVGDLLREALARMQVEGIPHGPVTDSRQTLTVMRRERVTALVGIPVQVYGLARLSAGPGSTTGEVGRSVSLKSVLLSTDRVPQVVAAFIERVWSCPVYNHYGTTEMGLGGGVDCRARGGYHLREADLFVEIVDPGSGLAVSEGERGEVVFTTLTRAAMPFIRYRTGDVSRFLPGPCPCGSRLRRLEHIDERLTGSLTLPSGRTLRQADLDETLFSLDGVVDFRTHFVQTGQGGTLLLRIKRDDTSVSVSDQEIARAVLAVPVISAETAQGTISLEVQPWERTTGDTDTGTRKRMIVQSWGEET